MTSTENKPAYQCEVCDKTFRRQQGLNYHLDHKVCRKHMCVNCGKLFKSALGLDYHEDNRVCYASCKIVIPIKRKRYFSRETVPFSRVSLSYVVQRTPGFQKYVFEDCKLIIPRLLEKVLCNENIDEYWSCYINNKKEPFAKVHVDGVWELRPIKTEFRRLICWALQTVSDYYNKYKGVLTDDQKININRLIDDLKSDGKKRLLKEINDDMFCLFFNHKRRIADKLDYLENNPT